MTTDDVGRRDPHGLLAFAPPSIPYSSHARSRPPADDVALMWRRAGRQDVRLFDSLTVIHYCAGMNENLNDLPLSPALVANLRAMYDDQLTVTERLAAALSVRANVENYTTFLAGVGRVSGMTWDEIAAPLQITRQTAYARFGHGLPAGPFVT